MIKLEQMNDHSKLILSCSSVKWGILKNADQGMIMMSAFPTLGWDFKCLYLISRRSMCFTGTLLWIRISRQFVTQREKQIVGICILDMLNELCGLNSQCHFNVSHIKDRLSLWNVTSRITYHMWSGKALFYFIILSMRHLHTDSN